MRNPGFLKYLVLIGLLFVGSICGSFWELRYDLGGKIAQGTVDHVSRQKFDGGNIFEKAQYHFDDAAGVRRSGSDRVEDLRALEKGETIAIQYLPSQSRLAENASNWPYLFVGVSGVALLVFVMAACRICERRAPHREIAPLAVRMATRLDRF